MSLIVKQIDQNLYSQMNAGFFFYQGRLPTHSNTVPDRKTLEHHPLMSFWWLSQSNHLITQEIGTFLPVRGSLEWIHYHIAQLDYGFNQMQVHHLLPERLQAVTMRD